MLISHKYKFITIEIPKTGTRSLREMLSPLGVNFSNEILHRHAKAKEVMQSPRFTTAFSWEDYKKFTIVRDPWKRYLSFYSYIKTEGAKYRDSSAEEVRSWPNSRINQGKWSLDLLSSVSFDDFAGLHKTIQEMESQETFICSDDGQILVDVIGRIETMANDVQNFLNDIGVKQKVNSIHTNKSLYNKPYLEYYNKEMIDMVAEKEQWVINKFNYAKG